MLTLIPIGGLANRLRSIASGVALARDYGQTLHIYWFKDAGLNCRFDDLCRWRSMDQLMTAQGYQLEGFHLWNTPMEDWYDPATLIYDGSSASTVSSPEVSEYLQPFHRISNQACYDGMTWKMAHYLEPIMIKQLQLTSTTGSDPATSTIYQNPYWPTVSDQVAER